MNSAKGGNLPRAILVTRMTRYKELMVKHHTKSNARFYLESLGADFDDYYKEDIAYERSLSIVIDSLQNWGRYQVLDRRYLPNFIFAADDIVIVLGQDGIVANTMKYLNGHPLLGVNPEVSRWDGVLLSFEPADVSNLLHDIYNQKRSMQEVTMARACLSDGQEMLAVNDLFIGSRTHTSALYDITHNKQQESQSSSGLIVSTGLGSTAWLKSVVSGSRTLLSALPNTKHGKYDDDDLYSTRMQWNTDYLVFVVREPFASRSSEASLIYGAVEKNVPLKVRSRMPANGVIFSDGMESDFLRFTAGLEVTVGVSERRGLLVQ